MSVSSAADRLAAWATVVNALSRQQCLPSDAAPRGRGSTERGRSTRGEFPADQKVGHRGGLHAAHGLEFASPLTVEQFAAFAEDRESRNPFAQRNLVALGDVEILIHASDIDVNEDVVGFQDGPVDR